MKKIVVFFAIIVPYFGFSQVDQYYGEKMWTYGFGFNIIDNTSRFNQQFLNSDVHWNVVSALSKISVERSISAYFGAEVAVTYNNISKENLQNGVFIEKDLNYFSLDLNGKFFVDQFFFEESILDAYVMGGASIYSTNNQINHSGNIGLGAVIWFQQDLGLRIQSLGKFAVDQEPIVNNHIQHSIELVFKF